MNDCDKTVFFNSNYDWGFLRVARGLNIGITLFVDGELFAQINDKLELIIDNIKL
jgi:hypothetical protein